MLGRFVLVDQVTENIQVVALAGRKILTPYEFVDDRDRVIKFGIRSDPA